MAPLGPPYRVLVSSFRGVVGGVDVFSAQLVRGLRARGIPASILLTMADDAHPLLDVFPGDLPVETLPGQGRGWRGRCEELVAYLEARAPCVYLPNHDFFHSCVSPLLSPGVAIVGIVHSDDPDHYDHARRLGRYWDALVAVSPAIARATALLLPELAPRVTTIPYGVETPPILPREAGPAGHVLRVVFHGRLVERQKRVSDLARVMAACDEARVPAHFVVIGDGEDGPALRQRCAPLVGRNVVQFLGARSHAEALAVVETCDVFLLTSEFEGLPLSLLEAMARGCVPVVTDIRSGIPDLVADSVNGFRLPVGDVAGFVDRLALLAGRDDLRQVMSRKAREVVAAPPYRLETMVTSYQALFEHVLGQAASGAYQRPPGRLVRPPSIKWWRSLPAPIRQVGRSVRRMLKSRTAARA
jgi:glycosyltransferase involved in cell wall biosynthesis